jgi:FAD dependent oxidoreductase TIGR03364
MLMSVFLQKKLSALPVWVIAVYAAISSFSVYFCMYAFRKPFTAASFAGITFLHIDYKVWLVTAQVIGYMLSKFYGIKFISSMRGERRAATIVILIIISWAALLLFAIVPSPYNIIFLFINGFPLGMVWGLVFSFLEGRKFTEFMGSVLAVSFIFSSGVVKSVGKYITLKWEVSDFWMPFITGALFVFPMILFTWLLNHVPPPSQTDIELRSKRNPMSAKARKEFVSFFLPGISIIVLTYVLVTILRDFRDNFANEIEWQVMEEYVEATKDVRSVSLLNAEQALSKCEAVNPLRLKGALWSTDEMIIEPRIIMKRMPEYLHDRYGITFHFNTVITQVAFPHVRSGKNTWNADLIFVCSGEDFETLYAEEFSANHLVKCKLQMMRITAQPANWRIGPALCGGLSLIHYKGFEASPSLPRLKALYENTMAEYIKWGIHVMVSQNAEGQLTIGDSHEYGMVHDPFNKEFINQLILDYLKQFALFKNWKIIQSWNGIYSKSPDGRTEFIHHPEPGVTVVNGLGGAGMTLSFGLAEEIIKSL